VAQKQPLRVPIISNYVSNYNYPLCLWSLILVGYLIDNLRHAINQKNSCYSLETSMELEKWQFKMMNFLKNENVLYGKKFNAYYF
jgi:hypothetical protein